MKHLLLSIAMLTATYASAQLTVRPNSGTDSYLYARDVVLFVEDDINLQKNAAGPTEASLYLRGDAQLIQGDSNGTNTGDGLLSVYQTIDSTSVFHYTYWNSPVSVTTGSGNQNAGISRFYDCDTCDEDDTAATQVQTTNGYNGSSTTTPTTVSTRWIYIKNPSPDTEVEANWSRINGGNGANPFLGFIFKGVSPTANPQQTILDYTFDMRGRPNNGDITIDMNGNTRVLTGNPYPSTIDLEAFYEDPDNDEVLEILYWDEPKDSEYSHYYADKTGGYGIWVPSGSPQGTYVEPTFTNYTASGNGTATTTMGANYNRRFAPLGQGFELRTDGGGDGIITFKNSHRAYEVQDGTNVVFRSTTDPIATSKGDVKPKPVDVSVTTSSNDPYEGYSPQIKMTVNINNYVLRNIVLGFDSNTTDNFDRGWDARSILDATFGGDAWIPTLKYNSSGVGIRVPSIIQFLPFEEGKRIPLTFTLTEPMNRIKISSAEEINLGHKAWLWDSYTDTAQEITNGGKVGLDLPKGGYRGRFYIVFKGGINDKNATFSTDESEMISSLESNVFASITFNQDNRAQVLNVTNPEGYDIKNLNLFDMSGKLVLSRNNVGNSTKFTFPTDNLADGVYLVLLTTQDDIQLDYKISVSNR